MQRHLRGHVVGLANVVFVVLLPTTQCRASVANIVRREGVLQANDFNDADATVTTTSTSSVFDTSTTTRASSASSQSASSQAPVESCSPLTNHGSYFSAAIKVGTPGQVVGTTGDNADPYAVVDGTFEVVADTGSNAVIVADCKCRATFDLEGLMAELLGQACDPSQICFNESLSSTFSVEKTASGKEPFVLMGFGSGQIEALVAKDKVAIGLTDFTMEDSSGDGALLLMYARKLNIESRFDGILGLGIPEVKTVTVNETNSSKAIPGFLEVGHISHFSMCFQDATGASGALRINTPPIASPLHSVGRVHWGLDFRGVSVGHHTADTTGAIQHTNNTESDALFCDTLPAGQTTPCGAIPDSGTTLIMAPEEQLAIVYEEICNVWSRCQTTQTTHNLSAVKALEKTLRHCNSWIGTDSSGLSEMPALHFHLRGSKAGEQQTLTFMGKDYVEVGNVTSLAGGMGDDDDDDNDADTLPVMLQDRDDYEVINLKASEVTRDSDDYEDTEGPDDSAIVFARIARRRSKMIDSGKRNDTDGIMTCVPAMSVMNMTTEQNGPIWILGTPLFYSHQVDFDLDLETSKDSREPAVGFAQGSCTTCSSSHGTGNGGLLETQVTPNGAAAVGKGPRTVRGPPLVKPFGGIL